MADSSPDNPLISTLLVLIPKSATAPITRANFPCSSLSSGQCRPGRRFVKGLPLSRMTYAPIGPWTINITVAARGRPLIACSASHASKRKRVSVGRSSSSWTGNCLDIHGYITSGRDNLRFNNIEQMSGKFPSHIGVGLINLLSGDMKKLQATFLLLQRLVSDAVSDLTPEIWSHIRLKRCKEKSMTKKYQNELITSGFLAVIFIALSSTNDKSLTDQMYPVLCASDAQRGFTRRVLMIPSFPRHVTGVRGLFVPNTCPSESGGAEGDNAEDRQDYLTDVHSSARQDNEGGGGVEVEVTEGVQHNTRANDRRMGNEYAIKGASLALRNHAQSL
ncbi:hypothetical protein J6590_006278 [Homalodisca vitripennis]|nr:hypothetical protein J6590_006278 [Homalodisca vitripennis]